jgi:mersacidin/lichenicidin family type 2 lantibiotic
MSQDNIIRAWKDSSFRNSLSEVERSLIPNHPVGFVELTDVDLSVVGGMTGCKCGGFSCTIARTCWPDD